MKKLLYFLAAAVMMVFACKPENNSDDSENNNNPGGGAGGAEVVAVTSIQVDIEPNDAGKLIVSYPVNAGRQSIGVSVTPANAVLSQHVSVECKQEGIVNWGYEGGGIYIIPQNEGTATFKLSARSGPAESVEFSVIITEKPAEPESVKISNTGANFQGGELMITEGDTYTIKATVKDDKGNNSPSEPLTWEVVEGQDYLSIDANGKVTAKAISGTTGQIAKVKVTVTSTAASANPLTDEVVVDIAAIAKLTIDRSGSSAGVFSLTAGSSMTLKAKVYNSREEEISRAITWSRASGDSNVTVDSNGKVSASESASQSATIQAVVTAKNSVKDNVSISIIPQPSSITISFVTGASNWKQYNDGKYYVKKGNELKFKATVSPSSANQEVTVSIAKTNSSDYGNAEVKGINSTASGTEFIFNPIESGPATFKITVKSSKKTSVSKSIEFGVDDYIGSNVKPGDYVYYNSSTGKFKSVDCGLRRVYAPSSNGYEASDGVRSSSPRSPQAPSSSYTYVGVLGCTSLVDSDGNALGDDFLKLSLLTQCRNGSNATGLYEYNTFRKSYLPGLENATALHGIVIGTRQSGEVIFQSTTEEIAQVNDTYNNTGLYQYQLKGVVALSEYQSKKSGYGEFVKYGLLNYLLLNFYNTHLKNFEGYHVEPVSIVASMTTSVPKMTSGSSKRTTGWFLPSVGEWELISPNLTVIINSFSASGSQADSFSASQYYWTPCEYDKDQAMHYRPSSSSNAFYAHGKNTSVGAGGGGSSKCIVRPMLYL